MSLIETDMRRNYFLNICHDIRTPLNVIMGMTSLACTNLDDKEKVETYLSRIKSTSDYLLELVNDILDLSTIDENKMLIKHEEFKLNDFVEDIKRMLEPLLHQKQLTFNNEINVAEENQNLSGDLLRLKQILINLLSNAIKYTGIGGNIELNIEQIEGDDPVVLKFQISDNGIGMSEEFMKKLFEPFAKAGEIDQGRNTTGLGLYFTKNLVTKMGGTIQIDSKAKIGTRVAVQLPFELSKTSSKYGKDYCDLSCISIDSFDFSNKRVLIVEDNEDILDITKEVLKQSDIAIECAKDGLEAIELFESSELGYYDVILMDVMMPKMDGNNATKMIRHSKHPDAKDIPIIGVTAKACNEDLELAMASGMDRYITKPINYPHLFLLLEEYFIYNSELKNSKVT